MILIHFVASIHPAQSLFEGELSRVMLPRSTGGIISIELFCSRPPVIAFLTIRIQISGNLFTKTKRRLFND